MKESYRLVRGLVLEACCVALAAQNRVAVWNIQIGGRRREGAGGGAGRKAQEGEVNGMGNRCAAWAAQKLSSCCLWWNIAPIRVIFKLDISD